jgi:hypothetical protein
MYSDQGTCILHYIEWQKANSGVVLHSGGYLSVFKAWETKTGCSAIIRETGLCPISSNSLAASYQTLP